MSTGTSDLAHSQCHLWNKDVAVASKEKSHSVYRLLPILPNECRLIKLDPASHIRSPIIVTIFVDKLDDPATRYDALSYAWGDGIGSETIIANGYSLRVTHNLQSALQHLRQQDSEVVLWVDSICINQNDTDERNHQVAKMGAIFSQASQVRIWLGAGSPSSNTAMKIMKDFAGLERDEELVQRIVASENATRALTELLRRPYWSRMWVFQEVVLSRKASVHCGFLTAEWATFQRLDTITGNPSQWPRWAIRRKWVMELRKAFFRITQFCIGKDTARYMINVLHPTRILQSTDPRDKLFALMGVCTSNSLLEADYSKSTRDVYMEFTRKLMLKDQDLSILLTAGPWNPSNGLDIDLPSWTPDYRGMSGVDIRYLAASHLKYFNASRGKDLPVSLYQQCHSPSQTEILVIKGIALDTINKTIPLGKGEVRRNTVTKEFDPLRLGPHPTGKHQFDVLFETMVFDNATMHYGSSQESRRIRKDNRSRLVLGFLHEINEFYKSHPSTTGKESDITTLPEVSKTVEIKENIEKYNDLQEKDPASLHWLREEYILRTEEATDSSLTSIFSTTTNYLGRGLVSIREGDIVAILFGSRLPFVLRKTETGSFYKLISPCHVSGAMLGELMGKLDPVASINGSETDDGNFLVKEFSLV